MTIEKRKNDHIRICMEEDISASRNYWDDITLPHKAIPAADLSDMDLKSEFLGCELKAPLIISAMTGGTPQARKYNEMLARAASEFGIGLGVGSQRAGIEKAEYRDSYAVVRDYDIPLVLGNIGAPQFSSSIPGKTYGREQMETSVEMINADGICIHLNYLQEVVQPEGDCYVEGMVNALSDLTGEFNIIAKETGAGISRDDALELMEAGVKAIDVGGMSGTTFSGVESFRDDDTGHSRRLGETFWDWGIPTPVSLREADVGLPLIATGGLRNGLDVARALSMGANAGGIAWKLLKAASSGYDSLAGEIGFILDELKASMFLTGIRDVDGFKGMDPYITGRTAEMIESRM